MDCVSVIESLSEPYYLVCAKYVVQTDNLSGILPPTSLANITGYSQFIDFRLVYSLRRGIETTAQTEQQQGNNLTDFNSGHSVFIIFHFNDYVSDFRLMQNYEVSDGVVSFSKNQ